VGIATLARKLYKMCEKLTRMMKAARKNIRKTLQMRQNHLTNLGKGDRLCIGVCADACDKAFYGKPKYSVSPGSGAGESISRGSNRCDSRCQALETSLDWAEETEASASYKDNGRRFERGDGGQEGCGASEKVAAGGLVYPNRGETLTGQNEQRSTSARRRRSACNAG
jgi:hypothetical protein